MAIDVDLHGQGKPGDQADREQAEFGSEEVEVPDQAAAPVAL
jgi:hypothetical protein